MKASLLAALGLTTGLLATAAEAQGILGRPSIGEVARRHADLGAQQVGLYEGMFQEYLQSSDELATLRQETTALKRRLEIGFDVEGELVGHAFWLNGSYVALDNVLLFLSALFLVILGLTYAIDVDDQPARAPTAAAPQKAKAAPKQLTEVLPPFTVSLVGRDLMAGMVGEFLAKPYVIVSVLNRVEGSPALETKETAPSKGVSNGSKASTPAPLAQAKAQSKAAPNSAPAKPNGTAAAAAAPKRPNTLLRQVHESQYNTWFADQTRPHNNENADWGALVVPGARHDSVLLFTVVDKYRFNVDRCVGQVALPMSSLPSDWWKGSKGKPHPLSLDLEPYLIPVKTAAGGAIQPGDSHGQLHVTIRHFQINGTDKVQAANLLRGPRAPHHFDHTNVTAGHLVVREVAGSKAHGPADKWAALTDDSLLFYSLDASGKIQSSTKGVLLRNLTACFLYTAPSASQTPLPSSPAVLKAVTPMTPSSAAKKATTTATAAATAPRTPAASPAPKACSQFTIELHEPGKYWQLTCPDLAWRQEFAAKIMQAASLTQPIPDVAAKTKLAPSTGVAGWRRANAPGTPRAATSAAAAASGSKASGVRSTPSTSSAASTAASSAAKATTTTAAAAAAAKPTGGLGLGPATAAAKSNGTTATAAATTAAKKTTTTTTTATAAAKH